MSGTPALPYLPGDLPVSPCILWNWLSSVGLLDTSHLWLPTLQNGGCRLKCLQGGDIYGGSRLGAEQYVSENKALPIHHSFHISETENSFCVT